MNAVVLTHMPLAVAGIIFLVGLFILLFKRNLVKIIMGVSLIESAVNLFLVSVGYREGSVAPIFTSAPAGEMALPTVQALTLTAIVIAVASTAMLLAFVMIIYRHYGTTNVTKIRKLRG
jgi:multicomponent Na+:H+ antiporter subunit C